MIVPFDMNVLFYTNCYPDPLVGGIERITYRLSNSLKERNFNCYFFYTHRTCIFEKNHLYIPEKEVLYRKDDVVNFISSNHIDIVICQFVWENYQILRYIKESTSCKVIFVFHNVPCYEYNWIHYNHVIKPLLSSFFSFSFNIKNKYEFLKQFVRIVRYKKHIDKLRNKQYIELYESCHKFVLLSDSFKSILQKKIPCISTKFLQAIPNMLSYDYFATTEILAQKEKVVLVVARMHEFQKRISRILNIWKKIEKDKRFNSWSLQIVGAGPDLESYKQYASINLRRITFYGKQEPRPFYEKASIFLMTSAFEGWGITLTEAQQFGCVPIVMNTYSAAKDIISNNENGFLVNYECSFSQKLKQLMLNADMRTSMAKNAICSSHKFDIERITNMWVDTFFNL